jgi:hypothetical protein
MHKRVNLAGALAKGGAVEASVGPATAWQAV